MKLVRRIVIVSAALAAALSACADESSSSLPRSEQAIVGLPDAGSTMSTDPDASAALPTCLLPPSLPECSDEQVVAILHASSRGEVMLAEAVMDRLEDPSVKDFAQRMITDHSAGDAALVATARSNGITPVENGLSAEIEDAAVREIQALSSKRLAELDRRYMQHEALDHQQDLALFDHILTPSIQNAALAAASASARSIVASHAQLSVRVLGGLEGACGGHAGQ